MTLNRRIWNRTASALLVVAAGAMLTGCGGGSMFGMSSGTSSSSSSSIGSRFSQLFGGNSQEASTSSGPSTQSTENSELTCPTVTIRSGASTLPVGLPGKQATGNDLRYQETITRTARDCVLRAGQIVARIGVQGRVIVGPAGAPPSVEVPMRLAVVQDTGGTEKIIVTKAFRTTVAMDPDGGNAEFSLVVEDVAYPVPAEAVADSYIFYVGFDPAGLKPEAPARGKKKK